MPKGFHIPKDQKEQLKHKLIELIEANAFYGVRTAARKLGISNGAVRGWINSDPDFKQKILDVCEDQHEYNGDLAENALGQLIKEGNPAAIFFYLKTKHKKRGYTERHEIGGVPNERLNSYEYRQLYAAISGHAIAGGIGSDKKCLELEGTCTREPENATRDMA